MDGAVGNRGCTGNEEQGGTDTGNFEAAGVPVRWKRMGDVEREVWVVLGVFWARRRLDGRRIEQDGRRTNGAS